MRRNRPSILWVILFSPIVTHLLGQEQTPPRDPEIVSLSPLGGRQGSSFDVQIRGQTLAGAHGVWFDCRELQATIGEISEIVLDEDAKDEAGEESPRLGQGVKLHVAVDPKTAPGAHRLRLLTPRGMSNPVTLHVSRDRIVTEAGTGHRSPQQAAPLRLPVVINGKLSVTGEADYFSFQARRGQELLFEAHSGSGILDPDLTLYEPSGSWFDPNQLNRLAFNDEVVSHSGVSSAALTFRFQKKGRYLVRVADFQGRGGADYFYQLRAVDVRRSGGSPGPDVSLQLPAHPRPAAWRERAFDRKLESDRLSLLRSRTVLVPSEESVSGKGSSAGSSGGEALDSTRAVTLDLPALTGSLTSVREGGANDTRAQALDITIPVIVEGVIERPGDVDHFKFEVRDGQKLTFEIETPDARPADFNPRLAVLDATGQELFSNISTRRVRVQPKTIEIFKGGGEYYLQIRDLTSRYGRSSFAYRVLIRPQIPHAGQIEIGAERPNLAAGEAAKLTVTTQQEEGFGGEIAIVVENLPPGVEAYPGTETREQKPPPAGSFEDDDRFAVGSQTATVLLVAADNAGITSAPWFARVKARPIVEGKPGELLFVGEFPIMVVSPITAESDEPRSR